MGLLDYLQNQEYGRGLLTPSGNPVGQWIQGVAQRTMHPLEAAAIASQEMMAKPADQLAMDWSNPVPVGLLGATAWHGSPHLFDKFKSEAIGTGEGAQVYGHGLYLAEHPEVAKSYAIVPDNIADQIGGKAGNLARLAATQANGDVSKYISDHYDFYKGIGYLPDDIKTAIEKSAGIGNIYKTDIPDTHIEKLLDWDKPLSQQHPDVQVVLRDMLTRARKSFPGIDPNGNPIGGQAYHLYTQHRGGNQSAVSDELAQAGIPGIKYLDASSRTAGDGTRNFVMFNPDDIRILERNGQPTGLKPWNENP